MFKKAILATALILGTASASNATTLFFDNFNGEAQGLNSTPSNWALTSGSVDIIGKPGPFPFYGPGNYIDMNGSTGQAGSIKTISTFNIFKDRSYVLSLDYGKNKETKNNESLTFGLIGSRNYSITKLLTGSIPNLINSALLITAIEDDIVSIFLEDSGSTPGDNGGPIVDNVRLSAVPLPAALPLMVMGLGALGVAARRRKAKTAI